jgi:hypothetical protein
VYTNADNAPSATQTHTHHSDSAHSATAHVKDYNQPPAANKKNHPTILQSSATTATFATGGAGATWASLDPLRPIPSANPSLLARDVVFLALTAWRPAASVSGPGLPGPGRTTLGLRALGDLGDLLLDRASMERGDKGDRPTFRRPPCAPPFVSKGASEVGESRAPVWKPRTHTNQHSRRHTEAKPHPRAHVRKKGETHTLVSHGTTIKKEHSSAGREKMLSTTTKKGERRPLTPPPHAQVTETSLPPDRVRGDAKATHAPGDGVAFPARSALLLDGDTTPSWAPR